MNKTVCAVLLAAGSSRRMGGVNKMLVEIGGLLPAERCAAAFSPFVDSIVIVASEDTAEAAKRAAAAASVPVSFAVGGERRQDSVLNGIMSTSCDIVAIHDCARCLVTGDVIKRAIESAAEFGSGAAALFMRDTVRNAATGETVPREELAAMQTPQCFDRKMLLKAYEALEGEVTDDAAVWQGLYGPVRLTEGSMMNQKLTRAEDIPFFTALSGGKEPKVRIGIGEDTHRLTEGRRLVLGGVEIPFRLGLLGHSDADALVHAVIDALLGAAALGDIGRHFPDSDPAYKDISSLILLGKVTALLKEKGWAVSNVDAVITAQEPKLAPFIDLMRKKTADAMSVGIENVSVKATTPEKLGPEGRSESITVRAVALVKSIG